MEKNKTSLYILSIVGIVAVVGILVIISQSNLINNSLKTRDVSGEAMEISLSKVRLCKDSDGSSDIYVKGTVSGKWYTTKKYTSFEDVCGDWNVINEGYCITNYYAFYRATACSSETTCYDGACVDTSRMKEGTDSDEDGISDDEELTGEWIYDTLYASNPYDADTDDDGYDDFEEIIGFYIAGRVGSDPNDASSVPS